MRRAVGFLVHGIFALLLSLIMWKLTDSMLGWAVLFLPGAALVIWGLVVMMRED